MQDWSPNATTANVMGLNSGSDYAIAVVVRGNTGIAALYDASLIRTADLSAPVIGSGLSYSNIAATTLTASWGAATDDATSVPNLQYKLVRASSAGAIDSIAEIQAISGAGLSMNWTAGTTTANVTGLSQGQVYYFNYLVRGVAGNIAIGTPVRTVTFDAVPPVAGSGISFGTIGETTVPVSWGVATDGTNASADLEYKLVKQQQLQRLNQPQHRHRRQRDGGFHDHLPARRRQLFVRRQFQALLRGAANPLIRPLFTRISLLVDPLGFC